MTRSTWISPTEGKVYHQVTVYRNRGWWQVGQVIRTFTGAPIEVTCLPDWSLFIKQGSLEVLYRPQIWAHVELTEETQP